MFYDVEIEMAAAAEVKEGEEEAAAAATGRRGLGSGGVTRHTFSGDDGSRGWDGDGGRTGGSANERVERLLSRRASEKWG